MNACSYGHNSISPTSSSFRISSSIHCKVHIYSTALGTSPYLRTRVCFQMVVNLWYSDRVHSFHEASIGYIMRLWDPEIRADPKRDLRLWGPCFCLGLWYPPLSTCRREPADQSRSPSFRTHPVTSCQVARSLSGVLTPCRGAGQT